jgi:hypothetical protein
MTTDATNDGGAGGGGTEPRFFLLFEDKMLTLVFALCAGLACAVVHRPFSKPQPHLSHNSTVPCALGVAPPPLRRRSATLACARADKLVACSTMVTWPASTASTTTAAASATLIAKRLRV